MNQLKLSKQNELHSHTHEMHESEMKNKKERVILFVGYGMIK